MNKGLSEKTRSQNLVAGALLLFSLMSCSKSEPAGPGGSGSDIKVGVQSPIIKTNMFDLKYERLHNLGQKKRGGGIGSTDDELVVITGDGQIHVINLENDEALKTTIAVPQNNQGDALLAADVAFEGASVAEARRVINGYLRYDDVLVLENKAGRHLVISYSYFDNARQCFTFKISVLSIPASQLLRETEANTDDWSTVYTAGPCFPLKSRRIAFAGHQSGGRIDVLNAESGNIVLALGDFEFDGLLVDDYPQDKNADYGKVWKINIHAGRHNVISIGHRNPQGITVDADGKIWSVEHGPRGGDELNAPAEGLNFGWPEVTLGIRYSGDPWPGNQAQGRHEQFDRPVFSWVPSIAPSNLDQVTGFHPFWDGDLLVFTLASTGIHRLRLHDNRVIFDEAMKFTQRIRYGMSHAATGSIYLWTDGGDIYRVRPTKQAFEMVRQSEAIYARHLQSENLEELVEDSAIRFCLECHTGVANSPPVLAGIIGAEIASQDYYGYSDALSSRKGKWTEESLAAFLRDPQAFAPGTTMAGTGLKSDEEISEVLRALRELSR
ncbi:MAG: PQQ-dependent sugar dehydrogenase [Gammaproteobacteria bacterium]|nr:PQQ-dependent sugar dehydrogenase [Gammaproteobacteria bacterium]NNL50928.1 hypothetical protein [Woeseiaceae bacterium]